MNDKQIRIIEILSELKELIPSLDKLVMDDMVDPDFILLCTEDYLETFIKSTGSTVLYDSDNNDDNGTLQ